MAISGYVECPGRAGKSAFACGRPGHAEWRSNAGFL